MRRFRGFSVLALLAALAFTGQARAQVAADRIPADAVVYVYWAGGDALGPAYDASHLKGFLDALNLPQYLSRQIENAIGQQGPEAKEKAKFFQDLLTAAAKSPTAFYFGPMDFGNPNQPAPKLALFSRMGKDKAAPLAEKLTAMIRDNPPGALPVGAIVAGDYLLFYLGDANLENRLTASPAPPDNLASTDLYKQAMAQLAPSAARPAATIFVNGEAGLKVIDDAVKLAPGQIRQMWPIISEGAGLTGVRQFAWAGSFDGPNWASQSFIGLKERRAGLLAFIDNPPLPEETYKLIPRTATWASVLRFDGPRLLADVRDVAGKATDNGAQTVDTFLQRAYAWTGIDFKNDLLPSLGEQFVIYSSPDATGSSLRGITLVNKLKDPEKAAAALASAETLANLMLAQRDPNTTMQFKNQPLAAPLDKVVAHVLPMPALSPAWAVHNGAFYLSMSVPGLQSAVEAAGGAKGSILDNPQFAALRRKIGHDAVSSFDFVDVPKIAPEYYQIMSQALMQQAANPDPTARYELPPLDKIMPHLAPAMSAYWSDRDGFHGRESSPFFDAGSINPGGAIVMRLLMMAEAQRTGMAGPATQGRGRGLP